MSKILVTVIVPVYNVSAYLLDSVASILDQTYSNLEIVLIDDGSTDGSALLCDNIATEDDRVKVLHKENGGLSSARNAGLDIMKGDFVFFLDSDDRIELNTIEYLVSEIETTDCDISIVGFKEVFDHSGVLSRYAVSESSRHFSGEDALVEVLYGDIASMHAWGKLYSSALFLKVRFPLGMLYEDAGTIYKVLSASRKVSISSMPMVHYLKRTDSITGSIFKLNSMDLVKFSKEILVFSKRKKNAKLIKAARYYLFKSSAYILGQIYSSSMGKVYSNELNHCRDVINEQSISVITNPRAAKKIRLYAILSRINKNLPLRLLSVRSVNKKQLTSYGKDV